MKFEFPNTKELKARFTNKQIKLDGEVISIDQFKQLNLDGAISLPDFLCQQTDLHLIGLCKILGVEADDMATSNIPKLNAVFSGKQILRMSKREFFVLNKQII